MTEMNQVLVVEDEVVIRTALKRLLERHEYKVSEAGTVKESIENFDMDEFDVIISDLRLPGAPGTDLIKATTTPVLIMTSYSSIRSAIDSMKLGAVDYIAKPFEHNELIESV
jgi:DNA-binding NtrC family response regulator